MNTSKNKHKLLYLMQDGNLYKIGITNNLNKRYKTFLTSNPNIQIIAQSNPISFAFQLEQKLHSILKKKRIHGEWFRLNSDDLDQILKILANVSESFLDLLDNI